MLRKLKAKVGTKIHQSWFVVALCIGVIGGTILGLTLRVTFFSSAWWLATVVLVLVVCYFQPRAFLTVCAVMAGAILALHRCASELAGEDYIQQLVGETVTVTGTIDGDPTTDETGTKFKLRDLTFANKTATKGNLYVSMGKNEQLARADHLTLSGEMQEGFGTYAGFLSRPEIVQWARPSPGDWVLRTRNWFAERVRRAMPGEATNLGLSYLLGMKAGLSDELSENLRTIGLTHIVVASGAHLSILVEIAKKFFGRLSKFVGIGASIIFILFFMALVGWTPSILRAGIMSILTLLAETMGRKFAPWRLILLVAAGTLLLDPMLIGDLGWLLSFASFAGIMILEPWLVKFFYGTKKPKFIANMVLTTLSATLLTLPITLYYFGAVSLISVIPNLLILPTLPYAMGLVFLAGVVSGVPTLDAVVGFLATKMLDFHIGVVNFFGQMKSFLVEIEPEQTWVFGLYAVVLVPLLIGIWQQAKLKRKTGSVP